MALRWKPDVEGTETHVCSMSFFGQRDGVSKLTIGSKQLQSEPENADYNPSPSELDAQDTQLPAMRVPVKHPRRYDSSNGSCAMHTASSPAEPILELPSLYGGLSGRGSDDFGAALPKKDVVRDATPVNISSSWQPPGSWDIIDSNSSSTTNRTASNSQKTSNTSTGEDRHLNDASHFQRFVRRMEGAGPRLILERLKEEWDEPANLAMSQELHLEKHLWALTALHLNALDRFVRPSDSPPPSAPLPPLCLNRRRKILELDGNLGWCFCAT